MIVTYIRTVIIYLVLILAVRLMGKRQIGQMEASEFVVTMLVANLAAIPMEDPAIPLFSGLVPILTVLALEVTLSVLSMRSMALRRLLCGKPVILIENGRLLQENLLATRVTLDELTGHLREKDVLDLSAVQFAILETNGNLSVFPYPSQRPASCREAGIQPGKQSIPITVISDGKLLKENMEKAGKDEAWVHRILAQRHGSIATTFLLTVDRQDKILFYPREGKA